MLHRWIIHPPIATYLYPNRHPSHSTVSAVNLVGVVQLSVSQTTEIRVCPETAASVHRGSAFNRGTTNLFQTTSTLVATHIKVPPRLTTQVNTAITILDLTISKAQIPNTSLSSPSHNTPLHRRRSSRYRLTSTAAPKEA
jgi:hypothetical protein